MKKDLQQILAQHGGAVGDCAPYEQVMSLRQSLVEHEKELRIELQDTVRMQQNLQEAFGGAKGHARRAACAYMYRHGIGAFGLRITTVDRLCADYARELRANPLRYPDAPDNLPRSAIIKNLSLATFAKCKRIAGKSTLVLDVDAWTECYYNAARGCEIYNNEERRDDIEPLPVNLDFLD